MISHMEIMVAVASKFHTNRHELETKHKKLLL